MLAADDVVYLMRGIRVVFVKQAVFTPIRSSLRNESPLRFAHLICQAYCVDEPAPSP